MWLQLPLESFKRRWRPKTALLRDVLSIRIGCNPISICASSYQRNSSLISGVIALSGRHSVAKNALAAATVSSMSAAEWAALTKPASYSAGA